MHPLSKDMHICDFAVGASEGFVVLPVARCTVLHINNKPWHMSLKPTYV